MVGCIYRHFKGISIHASAKEATCRRIICIFIILFYFNPRLREGGDSKSPALISPLLISIHASAKEATEIIVSSDFGMQFQSTPPRRRRLSSFSVFCSSLNFNPRLREGGDVILTLRFASHYNFNPRLREGGDRNIL